MRSGFEYVFQNYVYVPIISAIIGGFISIIVPKVFTWIGTQVKHKVNKSVDTIDISGEWNSFFTKGK